MLEELVVEVAKSKFLSDNPGRQRSPRGFTRDINLRLSAVNPGSAALEIRLAQETLDLFPTTGQTYPYLGDARDAIIEAISAAEKEDPIEPHLPARTLTYFDKLGRSLKEDETLEIGSPDHQTPARLTRDVRRRLVLASPTVRELTEEAVIRGTVPEADQDDMTFEIQLIDGRKIKSPIESQHLEDILNAFNGYQKATRALFQGVGRFSRSGQLIGFDSIEHLSLIDPLDIGGQLDELRLLEDGWLEGEGLSPPESGLDWLQDAFDQHFPEEAPLPHLYPMETGGVQAEWSIGKKEFTLELNLVTHSGEWHALDTETGKVDEGILDCDDSNDWEWLVDQIQVNAAGEG